MMSNVLLSMVLALGLPQAPAPCAHKLRGASAAGRTARAASAPNARVARELRDRAERRAAITCLQDAAIYTDKYRVDETGMIHASRSSAASAAGGRTIAQLQDRIWRRRWRTTSGTRRSSRRRRHLQEPERAWSAGAVRQPQRVQMTGPATLLDALARPARRRPMRATTSRSRIIRRASGPGAPPDVPLPDDPTHSARQALGHQPWPQQRPASGRRHRLRPTAQHFTITGRSRTRASMCGEPGDRRAGDRARRRPERARIDRSASRCSRIVNGKMTERRPEDAGQVQAGDVISRIGQRFVLKSAVRHVMFLCDQRRDGRRRTEPLRHHVEHPPRRAGVGAAPRLGGGRAARRPRVATLGVDDERAAAAAIRSRALGEAGRGARTRRLAASRRSHARAACSTPGYVERIRSEDDALQAGRDPYQQSQDASARRATLAQIASAVRPSCGTCTTTWGTVRRRRACSLATTACAAVIANSESVAADVRRVLGEPRCP